MGHEENDKPRMVKSPWFDEEIPFDLAAETGTRKVIRDHSTIGIVVTTDGTISEIPRENYIPAEKRVIDELGCDGGFMFCQDKMGSFRNDANPENLKAVCDFVREYA